jgi:TetR/AcrR family transcriptional regulator, regulator of cefoperazone and chloramphenicol sensitivity
VGRNRADGLETRRKLLDAAGVLFAKGGFRDTKTADICRAVAANVAAVNYHFGSKEELYVAAWRHEFERSIATYPPDGGVDPGAPAQERLRGHIGALVRRFMDPASRDLDIGHREMSSPTGLLSEVMDSSFGPLRRMHLGIVRELLGPHATEQEVQLCEMSVHAQCFVALMDERRRHQAPPGQRRGGPPPLNVGATALADHVARFSLAGIRSVRAAAGHTGPATRRTAADRTTTATKRTATGRTGPVSIAPSREAGTAKG